jgi:uncharacterized protein (DUF927 family)
VIDNLHEFHDGNEPATKEHAKNLINSLKKATAQHYGTPIREYLKLLVKLDCIEVAKAISDGQIEFHKNNVPDGSGEQVGRVAKRFALVAAGGELATDMGITGWKPGEATEAAKECFNAWLNARGTVGNKEDDTAIDQVRTFLEVHGASRFSYMDEKNHGVEDHRVINRAGYKRKTATGDVEYLLFRNVFRQEVCKGFDYQKVQELLIAKRFLAVDNMGKAQIVAKKADGIRNEKGAIETTESGKTKTQDRFYCILPAILSGS